MAASLPAAMAIPQSASFKARTSLTPSPTIPVTFPSASRAFTMACFFSGETRPKTVYFPISSLSFSSSSGNVLASTYRAASGRPARLPTTETVRGLSPDNILISTSFFRKKEKVSAASDLIISDKTIKAISFLLCVSKSTRIPSAAYFSPS